MRVFENDQKGGVLMHGILLFCFRSVSLDLSGF